MAKDKGYGLLHRRFADHPLWQEVRIFSRAEAWIDIVFFLARGTADASAGLKRGEFRASLHWLASRWNWDRAKVQRFMGQLTAGEDPMIEKMASSSLDARTYRVCKFGLYQDPQGKSAARTRVVLSDTPPDTLSDTPTDTLKPLSTLMSQCIGDTPPDTLSDTPTDTPPEEREKEKESTKEKEKEREGELNTGGKGSSAAARTPDEAFEIFAEIFAELRAPAKYSRKDTGGFVQLAKLRETMEIGTRETPPDWQKACRNYLSSPLGSFRLADLCVRYAVFVKHGLDRYNKPIGATNGKQEYESKGEALIRKQREAGERVRELLRGSAGNGVGASDPTGADSAVYPRLVGADKSAT